MDAFYKVHISFLLNECKHYIFKRLNSRNIIIRKR